MEGLMAARTTSSVFRESFKEWTKRMPSILFVVIIGTVWLRTGFSLAACMHLVIHWMVFLLLPAVRKSTPVLIFTAIWIGLNEIFCLPLRALFSFVLKRVRLSSEILPVVGIHAGIPCVWGVTVGAPHSFKMEHVEVSREPFTILSLRSYGVWWLSIAARGKFMQQIYGHLILRMCEGAHITIVARIHSRRVALTEFYFVLLRVIEFFHSVMRFWATIS